VSNTVDANVLRAVFAARVSLAKLTKAEAVAHAEDEWDKTQKWAASNSTKEGSFIWFCQEFDLDESAVLRAIRERRK
jgi:hypothetical protein